MSTADRFMNLCAPEPNSGCWLWLGTTNPLGYGRFRLDGKTLSAHRVAYELFESKIPNNLCVCHKCDVRCCVNPAHLFLGTHKDNEQDKLAKGRHRHRWSARYDLQAKQAA